MMLCQRHYSTSSRGIIPHPSIQSPSSLLRPTRKAVISFTTMSSGPSTRRRRLEDKSYVLDEDWTRMLERRRKCKEGAKSHVRRSKVEGIMRRIENVTRRGEQKLGSLGTMTTTWEMSKDDDDGYRHSIKGPQQPLETSTRRESSRVELKRPFFSYARMRHDYRALERVFTLFLNDNGCNRYRQESSCKPLMRESLVRVKVSRLPQVFCLPRQMTLSDDFTTCSSLSCPRPPLPMAEATFVLCKKEESIATATIQWTVVPITPALSVPSADDDTDDEDGWEYYSEEEDEEMVPKQHSLVTIPASLFTRWDWTIWDSDEETDDEEDLEEWEREFSPRNPDPVEHSHADFTIVEQIRLWLEQISQKGSSAFKEANERFHDSERHSSYHQTNGDTNNFSISLPCPGIKEGLLPDDEEDTNRMGKDDWRESHFCGDCRHGWSRVINADGCLSSLRLWRNGTDTGRAWQRKEGDTFIVTEERGSNMNGTFLYPDLCHVIHGEFVNGILQRGHFGVVKDLKWESDDTIPRLEVHILNEEVVYTSDVSSAFRISKAPLLRDPFEHLQVYVSSSRIPYAGEGLYAKRTLPPGELVALFNGVRIRDSPYRACAPGVNFSDYRIGLSSEICLDIPSSFANLNKYCATLGHKCCHSFEPNAYFHEIYHPRFGSIMSIVAIKEILRGQEVLVSYNYSLHQAPVWYRDLFFHHKRTKENKSEEFLYQFAQKRSKESGVHIPVPPPDRESSRFIPCGVCSDHVGLDAFSVSCSACDHWHHVKCIGEEDAKEIVEATEDEEGLGSRHIFQWKCFNCSA